jgi:pyruvate dehydrogenase E1 component alpha subunit
MDDQSTAASEITPPIYHDVEGWLHTYEQMLKIRLFEETVNDLYKTGKMPGLAHLYIGEEAIAVGVCKTLRRNDYITSTHRGHGHCLAKGASIDLMFSELLGKVSGFCRGKGGSMHIADPESGNLGANAIVGAGSGIATGAALSIKVLRSDQVAVAFFGEGAMGQGLIYEVMNMAALWKLPVIYICENNHYTEYTSYKEVLAGDLAARPAAFGIPVLEIDGQDVRQVYAATQQAVTRARSGDGPSFIICDTYRYYGHHVGDINRGYYRPKEEEERWKMERDPLKLAKSWLNLEMSVPVVLFDEIEERVRQEIHAGLEYAINAPYPSLNEVSEHVYA